MPSFQKYFAFFVGELRQIGQVVSSFPLEFGFDRLALRLSVILGNGLFVRFPAFRTSEVNQEILNRYFRVFLEVDADKVPGLVCGSDVFSQFAVGFEFPPRQKLLPIGFG